MTILYKTGDLLEAEEIAIAHGCNTQAVMGAGVAGLIRKKYPAVFETYRVACNSGEFRVGIAQPAWEDPLGPSNRLVYNLGTQRLPGPDATAWGVFLSFANMAEDAIRKNIHTVAIPRIGCGIGGLSWIDVEEAITEALWRSSHPDLTVVVYDLPGA